MRTLRNHDAFISYSHSADGQLAPALQTGLQQLAKPWSKRRALEVFRDQTGLSVSPDLWGSITNAMDSSRWFVLLASPEAAQSDWVDQEVARWLDSAPDAASRILPVLTAGTLAWDADAGTFSADTDAVPPALARAFAAEPRHIDLRWAHDDSQLDLGNPRWRQAVAEIAAPLHGVDQDELVGEDVRQHRKTVRVRRLAFVSLAVLTVGAVIASLLALRSANEADAQRAAAVEQQQIAEEQQQIAEDNAAISASRAFAAQSETLIADDPELAVLLAVEGLWPDVERPQSSDLATAEAETALRNSLNQLIHGDWRSVDRRLPIDATSIAIDPSGSQLASFGASGVEIWDVDSGERILGPIEVSPIEDPQLDFSPDGVRVLVHDGGSQLLEFGATGEAAGVVPQPASVVDAGSGVVVTLADSSGTAAWAPDGSLLVVAEAASSVSRQSIDSGDTSDVVDVPGAPISAVVALASGAFIVDAPGGPTLVRDGSIEALPGIRGEFEGSSTTTTWEAAENDEVIHRYELEVFDDDPTQVAFTTYSLDVDAGQWSRHGDQAVAPGTLAASSDGTFLAAADGIVEQGLGDVVIGVPDRGAAVHVWHPAPFGTRFSIPANDARDVAWVPGTRRLAIASQRGVEFVEVGATPLPVAGPALARSDDGSIAVSYDHYNSDVAVWGASLSSPSARYDVPVYVEGEFFTDPAGPLLTLRGDGGEVAVADSGSGEVALVDVETGEQRLLDNERALSYPIRYSPDGTALAGRATDGELVVVDIATGDVLFEQQVGMDDVCCFDGPVEWVGDGVLLYAELDDATESLSEIVLDTAERRSVASGLAARPFSLDVSPDGSTLAVGLEDGDVVLIDRASGVIQATLPGHTGAVTDVAFGENGDELLSASETILLRSIPDGVTLWSTNEVPAFAAQGWRQADFADSGAFFAGSDRHTMRIAGPDPVLACAAVSEFAIDRAEQVTGRVSACRRVLELRAAGTVQETTRPVPPPVVTLPIGPFEPFEPFEPAETDEPISSDDVPTPTAPAIDVTVTCPAFVDNEQFPIVEGERGVSVGRVQDALVGLGYAVDVDGCLGPGTAAAIREFQAAYGLPVSGEVDAQTWEAAFAG